MVLDKEKITARGGVKNAVFSNEVLPISGSKHMSSTAYARRSLSDSWLPMLSQEAQVSQPVTLVHELYGALSTFNDLFCLEPNPYIHSDSVQFCFF